MEEMVDGIHQALFEIHRLERTIAHFDASGRAGGGASSQQLLFHRLNSLVGSLLDVEKAAAKTDVHVPLQVVRAVDEGRNPDEFTREHLQACVQRNAATMGKVKGFQLMRAHLVKELNAMFPEEMAAYRDLRVEALRRRDAQADTPAALANGQQSQQQQQLQPEGARGTVPAAESREPPPSPHQQQHDGGDGNPVKGGIDAVASLANAAGDSGTAAARESATLAPSVADEGHAGNGERQRIGESFTAPDGTQLSREAEGALVAGGQPSGLPVPAGRERALEADSSGALEKRQRLSAPEEAASAPSDSAAAAAAPSQPGETSSQGEVGAQANGPRAGAVASPVATAVGAGHASMAVAEGVSGSGPPSLPEVEEEGEIDDGMLWEVEEIRPDNGSAQPPGEQLAVAASVGAVDRSVVATGTVIEAGDGGGGDSAVGSNVGVSLPGPNSADRPADGGWHEIDWEED